MQARISPRRGNLATRDGKKRSDMPNFQFKNTDIPPLGSIDTTQNTIGDTMISKTIQPFESLAQHHNDSLYTAIHSHEEITSGFVFPTVQNSKQAPAFNTQLKVQNLTIKQSPQTTGRGGHSMLMQYNQSLQGDQKTQTIPSLKTSLEKRTNGTSQERKEGSTESQFKTKKTVYTVKPIMVPVSAIEPRKLSKTQKQWCQYNNMIFNYPEKKLPSGNLIPQGLGNFDLPINDDGSLKVANAEMPQDYEIVK